MKTAPRFPTGYPSPLGFVVSLFGRVSKSYPGRGGVPLRGRAGCIPFGRGCMRAAQALIRASAASVPGRMAVRVALAGAAAGRLDGLTVHRSPCRWLEVLLCCAALPRVGDDLVSLGCVVETDCGRPPPSLTNTYEMRKPSAFPWVLRRPSRRSWAFPSPQTAMCHGLSGHEPFYQRFVFD